MTKRMIATLLMTFALPAAAGMPFPSAQPTGSVAGDARIGTPQYIQDSGRITHLYLYGDSIAIHLDGGFPNAAAANTCPTWNGFYAGNTTPNKALVAALMSAKASGSRVYMTLNGCDGGGSWIKFSDLYIVE